LTVTHPDEKIAAWKSSRLEDLAARNGLLELLRRARPPHGPPNVSRKERGENMTPEEIALEFAEIFDELPPEQINEMLAKNIPYETIEFFSQYAEAFADGAGIKGDTRGRLPNLLLFGYLIRVLEERLLPEPA
jgi:hypothetical protein